MKSIIIVEDESFVAQDLADCITKAGYQVTGIFASGEDMLSSFEKLSPDLVVMDIILNGELNGIETAIQMNHIKETPVIFLSAYSDQKYIDQAVQTNPKAYLTKPFKDKDLLANIELALSRLKQSDKVSTPQLACALEQAEIAKSTFLANMSHEFRTPIHHVSSYIDLMDKDNLTETQKRYLMMMKKGTLWLTKNITDIIQFCDIKNGSKDKLEQQFSLNELISDIRPSLIKRAKHKNLKFQIFLSEKIHDQLKGDAPKLKEVLAQLLDNAILHTHEGQVKLEIIPLHEIDSHIWLLFKVTDTGPGFTNQEAEEIFEPFAKLPDDKVMNPGLGLGLPIIKSMVKKMDGEIDVLSQIGQGSQFTIRLGFEKVDYDEATNSGETGKVSSNPST